MFAQSKYHSVLFVNRSIVTNALIIVLASAFLALISQLALHLFSPVPMTLQSAAVVLLGLTVGSKRATAAVALYLFEGTVGLPVFAGGLSGLPFLIGPSGGYLFGFLPAAFVAGYLMEMGFAKHFFTACVAAFTSAAVIFLAGVLHLQTFIGWEKAYLFGAKPFLLVEPVKLMVVSFFAVFCWKKGKISGIR